MAMKDIYAISDIVFFAQGGKWFRGNTPNFKKGVISNIIENDLGHTLFEIKLDKGEVVHANRKEIQLSPDKYAEGGGVGEKEELFYLSVSREVYSGIEQNSVQRFESWAGLERAFPEATWGIGFDWEEKKKKELGGYGEFEKKYYKWKGEYGYPYEIAKKVYDRLNDFDLTRNGISLVSAKNDKPILRNRWKEYSVVKGFTEKADIYAQGGGINEFQYTIGGL